MPRAYGRLFILQDGNSEGFFTASFLKRAGFDFVFSALQAARASTAPPPHLLPFPSAILKRHLLSLSFQITYK